MVMSAAAIAGRLLTLSLPVGNTDPPSNSLEGSLDQRESATPRIRHLDDQLIRFAVFGGSNNTQTGRQRHIVWHACN